VLDDQLRNPPLQRRRHLAHGSVGGQLHGREDLGRRLPFGDLQEILGEGGDAAVRRGS